MFDYIPNSYDKLKMNEKEINTEFFLQLQLKYKSSFEKLLNSMVNFQNVDKYVNSNGFKVPVLMTKPDEFYKYYSLINSQYVFLRNNIHVENLSKDDLEIIKLAILDNIDLSSDFVKRTLEQVLYEEGDSTFYGTAIDVNLMPSRSIVFGFAFDEQNCSIEESAKLYLIFDMIYKNLKKALEPILKTRIEMIVYNGF